MVPLEQTELKKREAELAILIEWDRWASEGPADTRGFARAETRDECRRADLLWPSAAVMDPSRQRARLGNEQINERSM